MKKISLLAILTIACSVLFSSSVMAQQDITIYIDNEVQTYDQPPIILDGSTYVPLRGIFEALGARVEWNNDTKSVKSYIANKMIYLPVGGDSDVSAKLINDRTMVPLRYVSEAMGAIVNWYSSEKKVIIKTSADIVTEMEANDSEIIGEKPSDGNIEQANEDDIAESRGETSVDMQQN